MTLTYVCAFCGDVVATFAGVLSPEPATMSVCDKPACRAQASARYKGEALGVPEAAVAGTDES